MSQHDFNVDNGGGAVVRGDFNDALKALVGNNAGASEPPYKVPGMFWLNTAASPNRLCIRNQADTAWIVIAEIDKGLVKTSPAATSSELVQLGQIEEMISQVTALARSLAQGTPASVLQASHRGCLVKATGNVEVPANIFASGDVVTIYNASAGSISIIQGANFVLRLVGSTVFGSRSLARHGLVTVVFTSSTEAVISGGGMG